MNSAAFIEGTVKSTLDNMDIEYEWIEVDPDFADTASFCKKYGFGMDKSGNTIILASKRGEKKYSACIVLGTDRLDVNKTVRNLMGVSRLSFANAEVFAELDFIILRSERLTHNSCWAYAEASA